MSKSKLRWKDPDEALYWRTVRQTMQHVFNQEPDLISGLERAVYDSPVGERQAFYNAGPLYTVTDFLGVVPTDEQRKSYASVENQCLGLQMKNTARLENYKNIVSDEYLSKIIQKKTVNRKLNDESESRILKSKYEGKEVKIKFFNEIGIFTGFMNDQSVDLNYSVFDYSAIKEYKGKDYNSYKETIINNPEISNKNKKDG